MLQGTETMLGTQDTAAIVNNIRPWTNRMGQVDSMEAARGFFAYNSI
jgi:hypothetical protein